MREKRQTAPSLNRRTGHIGVATVRRSGRPRGILSSWLRTVPRRGRGETPDRYRSGEVTGVLVRTKRSVTPPQSTTAGRQPYPEPAAVRVGDGRAGEPQTASGRALVDDRASQRAGPAHAVSVLAVRPPTESLDSTAIEQSSRAGPGCWHWAPTAVVRSQSEVEGDFSVTNCSAPSGMSTRETSDDVQGEHWLTAVASGSAGR